MALPSLRGVMARFLLRRLRTARAVARLAYRLHHGRCALIDRRGSLTYGQLHERVLRLHGWMQARDVQKGDIVATLLPETGEQHEVRLATLENGTLFAGLHQHLPAGVALEVLLRLQPTVFIHDPALSAPLLQAARERLPGLQTLALGRPYEEALAGAEPTQGTARLQEDDVFMLQLGSDTTGPPKAVGYSHRQYLDSVRRVSQSIDFGPPDSGQDIHMAGLPLTGPGAGLVLPTLLAGAALVVPENFRPGTLAGLIARHKVSRAVLPPSAIIDLLDDPALPRYRLGSLRHVAYGAETMAAPKMAEALRHFGPIFQQGYGSLEALPPISWLLPHEHVDASGAPLGSAVLSSAGRPLPGVEVVVRDEGFGPLPAGATGFITVRTPVRFGGYWNDPAQTRETLRDGWVAMGDRGYLDQAGYLHVMGRSADRVHKGGRTIDPRVVEEITHGHPAVKECCLVQHGDEGTALVVSLRQAWRTEHNWRAMEHDITEYLGENLAAALLPDRVRVVAEIPRSGGNRMLRCEVRAMLAAEAPVVGELAHA